MCSYRPLILENPDIIIGTPSRLMKVLRSGILSLKDLRCIVVDEADLIFTFGYEDEIRDLRSYLPQKIQVSSSCTRISNIKKFTRFDSKHEFKYYTTGMHPYVYT